MRVVGIDPAPKKGGTIYDGQDWETVAAHKLPARMTKLAHNNVVRIGPLHEHHWGCLGSAHMSQQRRTSLSRW